MDDYATSERDGEGSWCLLFSTKKETKKRAKKADKKKEIDLTEMTPAELNDLIKKATALKKKDGKKAAK